LKGRGEKVKLKLRGPECRWDKADTGKTLRESSRDRRRRKVTSRSKVFREGGSGRG